MLAQWGLDRVAIGVCVVLNRTTKPVVHSMCYVFRDQSHIFRHKINIIMLWDSWF